MKDLMHKSIRYHLHPNKTIFSLLLFPISNFPPFLQHTLSCKNTIHIPQYPHSLPAAVPPDTFFFHLPHGFLAALFHVLEPFYSFQFQYYCPPFTDSGHFQNQNSPAQSVLPIRQDTVFPILLQ